MCLQLKMLCSILWCPWPLLRSAAERNLKGSGMNKRKTGSTKLQRGFGGCAGSGAMCPHKEPSVRVVVLRIPVEYSFSHTNTQSHWLISHTERSSQRWIWLGTLLVTFISISIALHTDNLLLIHPVDVYGDS